MHIADLWVEGRKGVYIYNCRRKRIPVGNGSHKKRILIRVYSGPWIDECKLMLLAGPGSAFGGNEFGGVGGGGGEGTGWWLPHYWFCRTVSGRAPCGETAEMTNQGSWSLISHCWYDRSRSKQIWQLFSGCFRCCPHLFWCVGTKPRMHIQLLGERDPYRPFPLRFHCTMTNSSVEHPRFCFFLDPLTLFSPAKCTWYVNTQVILKFYPL